MKYLLLFLYLLISQYAYSQIVYKDKLTKDYFECGKNSDCTLVSGWCSYFAISKVKLASFNNILGKEKNSPNACPPGWVPLEMPKAICIKNECSTRDGKSGR